MLSILFTIAAIAFAQDFKFTIGGPVAAQDFRVKAAVFAFRTEGCPDPVASQVGGTAEGLIRGARQSRPLKVMNASKPGVYGVFQDWPREGSWVVNLKGSCGSELAGAVVPVGTNGLIRESAKFFARPATDAEINDSLKALAQGGNK